MPNSHIACLGFPEKSTTFKLPNPSYPPNHSLDIFCPMLSLMKVKFKQITSVVKGKKNTLTFQGENKRKKKQNKINEKKETHDMNTVFNTKYQCGI